MGHQETCDRRRPATRQAHHRQPPPLRCFQSRWTAVGNRRSQGLDLGRRAASCRRRAAGQRGEAVPSSRSVSPRRGEPSSPPPPPGQRPSGTSPASRPSVPSCRASALMAASSALTAGSLRPSARVRCQARGSLRRSPSSTGEPAGGSENPSGRLARSSSPPMASVSLHVGEDGSVRVIDAASRRVLSRPRAQKAPGSGLAFSPDGGLLAIGHFDGSIVLSDSVTGEPARPPPAWTRRTRPLHGVPTRRGRPGHLQPRRWVHRMGPHRGHPRDRAV